MSYVREIVEKFGWSQEDFDCGYKVTVYGREYVLVEGHGGIAAYEPNEVGFRLKKCRLTIRGEKLNIKEINRDEAYVKGKIKEIVYE